MRLISAAPARAGRSALWLIAIGTLALLVNVQTAVARRHHHRPARHGPRVFYVNVNGSNANSGTSPGRAWRSVSRVSYAALRPGDRVLFKGGQKFDDSTLMPGDGYDASGTQTAPIVFGSYGGGRATISQGVWFGANAQHPQGESYLIFAGLAIGPNRGFQGTGDNILLEGLHFTDITAPLSSGIAIQSQGSNWVIAHNRIDRTAGSGMLLGFNADYAGAPAGGSNYRIFGNVIIHTGLDPGLGYPTHGIYVKVSHATINRNFISDFRDDGVSIRYHDATITNNTIAHGEIGIGWYQYDATAGTSHFTNNTIVDAKSAGVFVCGVQESCVRPIENFVIAHNHLVNTRHHLNLQPSTGFYKIRNNR